MRAKAITIMLGAVGAALIAAGCSNATTESTPVPTLAATAAPQPTATPVPSPTATATPVQTPTAVPTATPNVEPTPTSQPPDALFTYTYAVQLLQAAQYEDATPQFGIVIRILPNFADAYHGRGLAYYHEEQEDLAVEDFSKAIELKPDFADAYRNRGVLYMKAGDIVRGAVDLEKALELYEEAGNIAAAEDVKGYLGP